MPLDNVIETVDLIKRYPTGVRRERGGFHHGGQVTSFGGVLNVLRRSKGPFIEALRGVSLQIKKGEVFGVLGPNGAGKTTLIKILCTLVIHDEGEAYVNGFDVRKEPNEVLKNLQAVLPESRGFNWRLTGRQNLEFFALLYGLRQREAEERIDHLLGFTGLKERANDGYQRYSTGMQRKLLLCRALLRNTPTLLFDEPTAGLDPASAAEFRDMLHDTLAKDEGKTILLSTHNLYEAQDMCDRIAILDRGKITACDTPDNIRHAIFEEKVFEISFTDAIYNDEGGRLVDELEEMDGVHGVTPEVDPEGDFMGISIRVNKNMDINAILGVAMKRGLKMRTVNTIEPTLEEAFIAITRQHKGSEAMEKWRSP